MITKHNNRISNSRDSQAAIRNSHFSSQHPFTQRSRTPSYIYICVIQRRRALREQDLKGDVSKDRQSGACEICMFPRILPRSYRSRRHGAGGKSLCISRSSSSCFFPFPLHFSLRPEITRKLTWKPLVMKLSMAKTKYTQTATELHLHLNRI